MIARIGLGIVLSVKKDLPFFCLSVSMFFSMKSQWCHYLVFLYVIHNQEGLFVNQSAVRVSILTIASEKATPK